MCSWQPAVVAICANRIVINWRRQLFCGCFKREDLFFIWKTLIELTAPWMCCIGNKKREMIGGRMKTRVFYTLFGTWCATTLVSRCHYFPFLVLSRCCQSWVFWYRESESLYPESQEWFGEVERERNGGYYLHRAIGGHVLLFAAVGASPCQNALSSSRMNTLRSLCVVSDVPFHRPLWLYFWARWTALIGKASLWSTA